MKHGYVTITFVGTGSPIPGYRTNGDRMLLFKTKRDAQLEIIDTIEEHIQQFKDEERDFEEIDFLECEEVRFAEQTKDGVTFIYDEDGPEGDLEFVHDPDKDVDDLFYYKYYQNEEE